jgi:hypothetical protein
MDMDIDAGTVMETDMETNMNVQRFRYRISVAKFIATSNIILDSIFFSPVLDVPILGSF